MEALLSFLSDLWDRLIPWTTVDPWEEGVRVRSVPFRTQKTTKIMPGVVFTIPFFDAVEAINVRRQVEVLDDQSVETSDRVSMLVAVTVKYDIKNVERLFLRVQDHDDSLAAETQSIVAAWVNATEYKDMTISNLVDGCYNAVRDEGWKWGCEVKGLGVNSLSKHRPYRLLTR